MRGGTALKFSPYFFPLSRSRLKIEKSTQYHGTVENREQRERQNTPEKAASQFESCLRKISGLFLLFWIRETQSPERNGIQGRKERPRWENQEKKFAANPLTNMKFVLLY